MTATATIVPADSRHSDTAGTQTRIQPQERPNDSGQASDGLAPERGSRACSGEAQRQYMRALERANEVRMARAELKRKVAAGTVDVAQIVVNCPWEAESMAVADLLTSQRRWGQTRCRKLLARVPMSERKTLGSMTDRQRSTLVRLLAEAGACELTGELTASLDVGSLALA